MLLALNTLLALPSVVVGLGSTAAVGAGPLGDRGILFTPAAMVVAQAILVTPIVAALARSQLEASIDEHGEQLRLLGAGRATGLLVLARTSERRSPRWPSSRSAARVGGGRGDDRRGTSTASRA